MERENLMEGNFLRWCVTGQGGPPHIMCIKKRDDSDETGFIQVDFTTRTAAPSSARTNLTLTSPRTNSSALDILFLPITTMS